MSAGIVLFQCLSVIHMCKALMGRSAHMYGKWSIHK